MYGVWAVKGRHAGMWLATRVIGRAGFRDGVALDRPEWTTCTAWAGCSGQDQRPARIATAAGVIEPPPRVMDSHLR